MSSLEHTPNLSPDAAKQVASEHFGIDATSVAALPSERDQNFKIATGDGKTFVLKIANGKERSEFLEAQNEMATHLARHVDFVVPPIFTKEGRPMVEIKTDNSEHLVRLMPFLEGTPLSKFRYRNPKLIADVGRRAAQLRNALIDFDHGAFHRDFHWDLASAARIVEQKVGLVQDGQLRREIEHFAAQFQRHTAPLLDSLPRSVIHNDMNDGNVIIHQGRVAAVIDLGDAVYSWSIGELAIAISYSILEQTDPVSQAAQMVAAHHDEVEIGANELEALFGLICMRLCVSAVMSAEQQQQRPDDPYLSVSQEPIRRTLPGLKSVPYKIATAMFRTACQLPATDYRGTRWLAANQCQRLPLLIVKSTPDFAVLDCSVASSWLTSDLESISTTEFTRLIEQELASVHANLGIGRYLEPRLVYAGDQYVNKIAGGENRTIHLGIDLFARAGTPVVAPIDGFVQCVAQTGLPLDYGNLVILRHEPAENIQFFTLYGHLADQSAVSEGQAVKAGDTIGWLGDETENGGWSPHLHFQIMLDLLDYENDFPGACVPSHVEAWSFFCPDPNLILGLPSSLNLKCEFNKPQAISDRKERIGSSLSIGYEDPLKTVRGWKHWLYDESGRRYLDAYNNVPHVGHCHPTVVQALSQQARLLNTNTRYLGNQLNEFAARVASTLPAPLEVCFFLNSASEANELALRLARTFTGQKDLIVLEGAYHGHTTTLIDISPYKHDGPGGCGSPDWVHTAEIADVYRGQFRDAETAGPQYAAIVDDIITRLHKGDRGVSSFIAESCPSVGGQIIFPDGYLSHVYRSVRRAGGICIADEVQTGYGRLGSAFYGFQLQDVVPDVVVLGKPIGNGHPLAAVVTTRAIADAFDNGMEFFSTFGGNNVSCAVGLAVLEVLEDEGLQHKALETGNFLIGALEKLKSQHGLIGDVRGSGLFLGVELVRDRDSLEPAATEASFVVNRMRELGVLVGTDGPLHNVIKIRPPMTFGMPEAKVLMTALQRALDMLPPT